MSNINTGSDAFSELGLSRLDEQKQATNDINELGLDTFFTLMTTQLNNQDPFKPMENGDFLTQIAQFGSVSGMDQLNTNFEELSTSLLSGQAMQAGTLVGHDVLVANDTARLQSDGNIRGRVELESPSTDVVVQISDQAGQLVRELQLGATDSGELDFVWDGFGDDGNRALPGTYKVQVQANEYGENVELSPMLFANVESVNISERNGMTLNLQGLGTVDFDKIKQIY